MIIITYEKEINKLYPRFIQDEYDEPCTTAQETILGSLFISAQGTIDGKEAQVLYSFSNDEAKLDMDEMPWDVKHVIKITIED